MSQDKRDLAIAIEHLAASISLLAQVFQPNPWYSTTSAPPIPGTPKFMEMLYRFLQAVEKAYPRDFQNPS